MSGLRWPKHFGGGLALLFLHVTRLGFLTIWWCQDTQPRYTIADVPQSKCSTRPRWTQQSHLGPSFRSHTASLLVHSMSYTGLAPIHGGMRQLKGIDTRKWSSWWWDSSPQRFISAEEIMCIARTLFGSPSHIQRLLPGYLERREAAGALKMGGQAAHGWGDFIHLLLDLITIQHGLSILSPASHSLSLGTQGLNACHVTLGYH